MVKAVVSERQSVSRGNERSGSWVGQQILITRRITMFETEKEYGQAMLNGRVFDIRGNICKFEQNSDITSGEYAAGGQYSPFVCKRKNRDYWEFMDELWYERKGIKEIFPDLPDLQVGTMILVKDWINDEWELKSFKQWVEKDKVVCELGKKWCYWKIAEGEFEGETSYEQGGI